MQFHSRKCNLSSLLLGVGSQASIVEFNCAELSDDSSACDRSVVPSARSISSCHCGREEDTSIATVAENIDDLAHATHQSEASHAARS